MFLPKYTLRNRMFGHISPAILFVSWGIISCILTCRRYFQHRVKHHGTSKPFVSHPTWPIFVCGYRLALEAWIPLLGACISAFVHAFIFKDDLLHASQYLLFGVFGIAALTFHRILWIENVDTVVYICLSLSYMTEGLGFLYHRQEHEYWEEPTHQFMICTVFATAMVVLLEIRYRNNMILPLARAFLTLLQGTWLLQIGVTFMHLFMTRSFDESNSANVTGDGIKGMGEGQLTVQEQNEGTMFIAVTFIWHVLAIFIVMFITVAVIGQQHYKKISFKSNRNKAALLDNDMSEVHVHTPLLIEEDVGKGVGQL